jgi:beta-glucosidase
VARYGVGGVLSGGGGYPARNNTVAGWTAMVHAYQDAALSTRLAIPVLYGVDAVHGHANLAGAVVFPHNVGLGAAADAALVEEISRATAREMIATGIYWNYAPVLAVPRDIRWGRTYEGYGEDTGLVTRLSLAALRGLQGDDLAAPDTVLATPKHFVGDGGTSFGTSTVAGGLLDRGDTDVDEATLRSVHLAPYVDAVSAGARSIMVSFSSWRGEPMHGHAYLIQDVLRGELGFTGFVVSDWAGIDDVAADYRDAVVASVNAGIDMNMVPYDGPRFIRTLLAAVERGDVTQERVDEAVTAILRVKFELGLFERPYGEPSLQASVGSDAHRAIAREAVARTLVLLKNEQGALPLRADAAQTVLVAGSGAHSVGVQSGGWTIEWQGSNASLTPGTTILEGLQAGFGDATTLLHSPRGRFTAAGGQPQRADVGIAVVGEPPYAEWFGDTATLRLGAQDSGLIARLRDQVDVLVVVLLSGRPLVMDAELNLADAVVAAWLPGSEGDGVTDVLFGGTDFVGTLPYTWPRRVEQLPFDFDDLREDGCDAPLFPRGYGLSYADAEAGAPWLALAVDCAAAAETTVAPPVVALPDPDGPSLVDPALLRPHRPREVMAIPFPVPISLDGDLSDWNGIPFATFDTGPMPSRDPAENGHVQFAVAADTDHLYLYMVMPDATIVTGQHGNDYWNEDSLEFYLNFSGDLERRAYGDGVFQVNVNPTNLGNTDPAALVVTGIRAATSGVRAFVFPTADGWGFEASVPIPAGVELRHGLEIGLQAHANGSSGGSRDVKLIWSAADTNDTSWQNPAVFGRGVFYEVGNPASVTGEESEAALRLVDVSDGVPTGRDAFNNALGFSTWQDGGGALALSAVDVAPGDALALPGQTEPESVLRVDHRIASWGGFTHAFFDDDMTRWIGLDLSGFLGIRFWYAGDGRGGTVQLDLFDNRNPNVSGDSAERWFYRFRDDTTEWKLVEVPFSAFARRTDFQPGGAPNDGLGLDQASGWALGFPPGEGTSHVARVEVYGSSGVVREGVVAIEFAEAVVGVDEGDEGTLRIVLSEASDEAVSVRVYVQGDEATPFRDLIPVNELVVFPPGVTEATVTFRTLPDSRHEGDERAVALLDGPRGAELGFQRRAVIEIRDTDPFDPDLIAEFGDGPAPFEPGPGTTVRPLELLASAANARPGQDRFEPVLAFAWEDAGAVLARFAQPMDASHADGLEFWFHGDGGGREVRALVLDGRDESRPWELVWSDEFEGPAGTGPDPAAWTPEIGDGTANGIPGWGNAERQTYTDDPANVALDGAGSLVIRALETGGDAPPCYYGAPCEYTSARIITAGKVEATYGRIEARLKIPRGQGLWPAFWMLGNDIFEVGWPESGEIDVMENIGREPSRVHGTIHGPGYSGGNGVGRGFSHPDGGAFADDFHVYAVDWSPEGITWSVDGVAYSTVTPADLPGGARWVFDHPFFLILNVAVGGHWPGYPDASTVFPQEMVVDYVRIYQMPDTSTRYAAVFRDDTAGWVRVRLPFADFERAAGQPDAVSGDGFERREVWGVGIEIGGGPGTAMIDELRWYVEE